MGKQEKKSKSDNIETVITPTPPQVMDPSKPPGQGNHESVDQAEEKRKDKKRK